jgi:hypothetical protein
LERKELPSGGERGKNNKQIKADDNADKRFPYNQKNKIKSKGGDNPIPHQS